MPLGLLMLMMADLADTAALGLHFIGITLVLGRIVHALHLSFLRNRYNLRVVAITMTFASYLVALSLSLL